MIKNLRKKGFTIVELVIVIAVIAILAAILIPTFSGIIRKANIANDTALAKNMNTALVMAEAEGREVEDVSDVLQIVNEAGYVIENLNPTTNGYYFVWDEETNQILFIDDAFNIVYSSAAFSENKLNWWCTVGSADELEEVAEVGISLYFENDISGDIELTKLVSLDTGYFKLQGTLEIDSNETGEVVLKGRIDGPVTINAPNATISQYGTIKGKVTVTAIASASLHIFGFVNGTLDLTSGHVVVENSGYVFTVTAAAASSVRVSGVVGTMDTGGATPTVSGGLILGGSAANNDAQGYTHEIANRTQLENFRAMVNGGQSFKNLTVELTADINLGGEPWTPIGLDNRELDTEGEGNVSSYFSGTFDGKNHTISNMTNSGYVPTGMSYTTNSEGITGYVYGLFGCVYGQPIEADGYSGASIKNLKMTGVNIVELDEGNSFCVGAVVGAGVGNVSLEALNVSGSIKGTDAVGGIAGYTWVDGKNLSEPNPQVVYVNNCTVNAKIVATNKRASGILGSTMINYKTGYSVATNITTSFTLTSCNVSGTVTSLTQGASGLFCASSNDTTYGWPTPLGGTSGTPAVKTGVAPEIKVGEATYTTYLLVGGNTVSATIKAPKKVGQYEGYTQEGFVGTDNNFTGTMIID